MQHKLIIKIITDVLMGTLFLSALAPRLTGVLPHEIIGTALGVLFLVHTALNIGWYKNLIKGPYTVYRTAWTAVNLLLLAAMAGMIISGVLISRHLFTFLPFSGGFTARRLHTLCAYWGFILTAVHVGLHGAMIRGALQKRLGRMSRGVLYIVLWAAALYGVKASFDWHMGDKLSMVRSFNNWDGVTLWSFGAEFLSVACLYALGGYYVCGFLARLRRNTPKQALLKK